MLGSDADAVLKDIEDREEREALLLAVEDLSARDWIIIRIQNKNHPIGWRV